LVEFPLQNKGYSSNAENQNLELISHPRAGICKKPSIGLGFIKQDLDKPNCSLVSDLT